MSKAKLVLTGLNCPKCNRPIDIDDIHWFSTHNESGTDIFEVSMQCRCGWSVGTSGYGFMDAQDAVEYVERRAEAYCEELEDGQDTKEA